MVRIGMIHATELAIDPVHKAFSTLWPESELKDYYDPELQSARTEAGSETPEIINWIGKLGHSAAEDGADAILYTCSAFPLSIEQVQARYSIPVLKPNDAMFHEALATGGKVGLVATFGPSIPSMTEAYAKLANRIGADPSLQTVLAEGALDAAVAGNPAEHNRLIAEAAKTLEGCDVIMLAQFSMVDAADAVREATGITPLTSPASAVRLLKTLLD